MTRFRRVTIALLLVGFLAATTGGLAARADDDGGRQIVMRDDCDPNGGWEVVPGGCERKRGNVSLAEFNAELDSPLAAAVIGHQAWRNDPSYLVVKQGKTLRIRNKGGRPHTFTKVANFGGGVVPQHNEGLVFSPECAGLVPIAPGESARLSGLTVGNHRFLCCFHPWMRALVKVTPRGGRGGDD